MTLDPFYPIVDGTDWLRRLLPQGLRLVQLRVKDRPEREIAREVRTARALCAEAGCQLVVNDYWQIAIGEGCDFVHLGQEDLDAADLAAIRRAGLRLGVSTHDRTELERAVALEPAYVALGPIYPTVLKAMKWRAQGVERLREWKTLLGPMPLVAIGGFTPGRAAEAFAAGADVVSVVTDILRHPEPETRTREWIHVTRTAVARM